MTRDKALRQAETILKTRIEMHHADLGTRGQEAVENAISDIQAMLEQVYDDHVAELNTVASAMVHTMSSMINVHDAESVDPR